MVSTGAFVTFGGFFILLAAMFQMMQFNKFVKDSGNTHLSVPFDIIMQCLLGTFLCIYGSILVKFTQLKAISAKAENTERTWESSKYREDFAVFNHRGSSVNKMKSGAL